MNDGAKYPSDYPDNCPPAEARDGPQELFRVVRSFPVVAEDFRSAFDRGAYKSACPCRRRGLSCLQTLADARHCSLVQPYLGKIVVRGTISPEHGKLLETEGREPSHTTWWVASGVDPLPLFSLVDDDASMG